MNVLRFTGRLVRSPFPGRPLKCTTRVFPLTTAADYIACSKLPSNPEGTRVFVSFPEKYELLDRILSDAMKRLAPIDYCLMTAMMPGGTRMPESLLRPNVFICETLQPELDRLLADGLSVLTLEDRILRQPMECGDNSIRITWYSDGAGHDRFQQFAETFRALGIESSDGDGA